MRGWLAAVVDWFQLGERSSGGDILLHELAEGETAGDVQDWLRAFVDELAAGDKYPRLTAWVEQQLGGVNVFPLAIFRD